jgi:flavin reductase (DIM6/NTAB) family NADH-FMN oxidoreductase RutF
MTYFRHIDPSETPTRDVFRFLLGGVGPRPIALVSTISADGVVNLSPFSFFNAFGANPPTVAFSPSRRLRDNTTKDTYSNIIETEECVIHAVSQSMLHQMNLSSAEFPADVNEFAKAGFTEVASEVVRPPRVAESPFQMECTLTQMVRLGDGGASGNLAICEVVRFHIAEEILAGDAIDQRKIDLVARMGGEFYCHASGDALFELPKPAGGIKLGVDGLPARVISSGLFSGNDLGRLGAVEAAPDLESARLLATKRAIDSPTIESAKAALDDNDVELAWALIVCAED